MSSARVEYVTQKSIGLGGVNGARKDAAVLAWEDQSKHADSRYTKGLATHLSANYGIQFRAIKRTITEEVL